MLLVCAAVNGARPLVDQMQESIPSSRRGGHAFIVGDFQDF